MASEFREVGGHRRVGLASSPITCGGTIVMSGTASFQGKDRRGLFISGRIGLGHVTRDLAIPAAPRTLRPDLDLKWLAADPAKQVLKAEGEQLVPEAEVYLGETGLAEDL